MPLAEDEKRTLLRGVGLFAGLDDETLALVAERTREFEFAAGQHIVRQGDLGTGFYLLVRGRVRVMRGSERRALMGPGDFFGELSVLDHKPRTAHVIAEEPVTCLALAAWDLNQLLEQNPRLALNLVRELVRRLRDLTSSERH